MKFKLLSDLHLEFYNGENIFYPEPCEDDKDTVLLLAGDIHVGRKATLWLKDVCEQFKHVVYILGNHEFYHNEWYDILDYWMKVDIADNFTYLDDDVLKLDGVRILGGVLWTAVKDQTNDIAFTVWNGKQRMTDYNIIRLNHMHSGQERKLHPYDTMTAHDNTVMFLKAELAKPYNGKTIVMTHHLPHLECVAKRFRNDALNPFFVTDLDELIKNNKIDVWCHGHTHDRVDITVHDTRILCNPYGYEGIHVNKEFKKDLTFEV